MTALVGFATARKTSRADLIKTWLAGGKLAIYSGTRPATADTAITNQVKLVEFSIPDPAGTTSNGVLTAATIAAAMVLADGTAAWARARDSSSVTVADLDVGVTSSGAAVEMDDLSLVSGGMVSVTSFTITEG